MGAHLATFETEEKWKNIRKIIKERVAKGDSDYVHWYIGLRKENGTWRWVGEGSPGVSITDKFPWQKGEPNTKHGVENCGEINASYQGQDGYYNNVKCNHVYWYPVSRGYICEKTANNSTTYCE